MASSQHASVSMQAKPNYNMPPLAARLWPQGVVSAGFDLIPRRY